MNLPIRSKITAHFIALGCAIVPAYAQQWSGMAMSNYGGIYQAQMNPATLTTSRLAVQAQLLSGNAFFMNDFIKDPLNGFKLSSNNTRLTGNANLNAGFDLVGPAFMFTNKKFGIMAYSKLSVTAQIRNVSGATANYVFADKDKRSELDAAHTTLVDKDFSAGVYSWAEFGASFGQSIVQTDKYMIGVGGGAKFIVGGPCGIITGRNLLVNTTTDKTFTNQADVTLRYAGALDEQNKVSLGKGAAVDLGAVYEQKEDGDAAMFGTTKHKLMVGAALTNLGFVHYGASSGTGYVKVTYAGTDVLLSGVDSLSAKNGSSTGTLAEKNFDSVYIQKKYAFNYMTRAMLNLHADYHIKKMFFVSAILSHNLVPKTTPGPRGYSSFLVAPRIETKIAEVSLPLGMGLNYKIFQAGLMVRVVPFFIGTDNVLPLIAHSGYGTSVYGGIVIPVGR